VNATSGSRGRRTGGQHGDIRSGRERAAYEEGNVRNNPRTGTGVRDWEGFAELRDAQKNRKASRAGSVVE